MCNVYTPHKTYMLHVFLLGSLPGVVPTRLEEALYIVDQKSTTICFCGLFNKCCKQVMGILVVFIEWTGWNNKEIPVNNSRNDCKVLPTKSHKTQLVLCIVRVVDTP